MKFPIALATLALALAGCVVSSPATKPASNLLSGDAAHPAATTNWVRTELYFGLDPIAEQPDAAPPATNEKRWQAFLDREVTPRFPDGLSVYDVYGQWRTAGQNRIERLHSKELMVLYPDTPQHRADIEAIRAAWKKETGDLSVLRVTQSVDVSF
ncbi:MAG: DUF3574 domain-containing protein [Proteobacteria bacterium]|nr:DUF3574 domain-containing protein [Pseudomonadota bacterium]